MLDTIAELGIDHCHLIGASYGAGVAAEVALTRPERVKSLLLRAPGGSLIAQATPDLRAFFAAERAALAKDDLNSGSRPTWPRGSTVPNGTPATSTRRSAAWSGRCTAERSR